MLEFRVRAKVRVKVRARVSDSWGTKQKRLGTKRLGYEMSGCRNCWLLRDLTKTEVPVAMHNHNPS